MNREQIKLLVDNLIKRYETRNPITLAKDLGITIQIGELKNFSGCHLKIHDRKFIYVNERLEERKALEVVAHELGHCLLHDGDFYFFSFGKAVYENVAEKEAYIFSSELLIPDNVILDNPNFTQEQLSMLTGFSQKLIEFKQL